MMKDQVNVKVKWRERDSALIVEVPVRPVRKASAESCVLSLER
jgi:hypothetical protein